MHRPPSAAWYLSRRSEAAIPTLSHRACPSCATPVPWTRWLLKTWIWARWPCPTCGTTLRFDGRRRAVLVAAVLGATTLVAVVALAVGLGAGLSTDGTTLLFTGLVVPAIAPLMLLEGVARA